METNRKTAQYLTFSLDDELFGINVVQTREILDLATITRIPQTPGFMLGVLNLRGSVVPVVDLRIKFGMPARERTVDSCIIVMDVQIGEATITVGALVDAVQEVIDLAPDQIEPPPRLGTRLNTAFIQGMGCVQENFLILLDINRVFSNDELVLVQDILADSEAAPEPTEAELLEA